MPNLSLNKNFNIFDSISEYPNTNISKSLLNVSASVLIVLTAISIIFTKDCFPLNTFPDNKGIPIRFIPFNSGVVISFIFVKISLYASANFLFWVSYGGVSIESIGYCGPTACKTVDTPNWPYGLFLSWFFAIVVSNKVDVIVACPVGHFEVSLGNGNVFIDDVKVTLLGLLSRLSPVSVICLSTPDFVLHSLFAALTIAFSV